MKNIGAEDILELKDFRIVASSDSGIGKLGNKHGLGYVAVQLTRGGQQSGRKNVIVLAFRGTEFQDDLLN
ncbi:MAG TPA: hypothetical protein GX707_10590, partial [Epulopiscium sp.]|nr:hypothetical protein [Candidatus Epulonipiscium sp.]